MDNSHVFIYIFKKKGKRGFFQIIPVAGRIPVKYFLCISSSPAGEEQKG